jgi:hypothetical protein
LSFGIAGLLKVHRSGRELQLLQSLFLGFEAMLLHLSGKLSQAFSEDAMAGPAKTIKNEASVMLLSSMAGSVPVVGCRERHSRSVSRDT